jgi:hypothetical protein
MLLSLFFNYLLSTFCVIRVVSDCKMVIHCPGTKKFVTRLAEYPKSKRPVDLPATHDAQRLVYSHNNVLCLCLLATCDSHCRCYTSSQPLPPSCYIEHTAAIIQLRCAIYYRSGFTQKFNCVGCAS